jgi:hypothetical protein
MIKLTDSYFIDADKYQYILKEIVTRTNKKDNSTYEAETTVGFYRDVTSCIKSCLNSILRDKISNNKITDLNTYMNQIQTIYDKLNSMLNPLDIKKLSDKIQN